MFREKVAKTKEQAIASLCRTCSKMERCKSDIRRSLYRYGITQITEQEQIIEYLERSKFIDEARYTAAFVREKLSGGRWGVNKIVAALRAKGVNKDIINEAISQNIDTDLISSNLESTLRRKAQSEIKKGGSGYKLRAKLFRFAASRGHDFDGINDILNTILSDDDF